METESVQPIVYLSIGSRRSSGETPFIKDNRNNPNKAAIIPMLSIQDRRYFRATRINQRGRSDHQDRAQGCSCGDAYPPGFWVIPIFLMQKGSISRSLLSFWLECCASDIFQADAIRTYTVERTK
jgi:hypothetical protein